MASPHQIDLALHEVHDQASFLQRLLIETLDWPVTNCAESVEDISYGWTQDELRVAELDRKVVDGHVWQLQPLTGNQPWGVFLLEFNSPDAFVTGRGMTGPLRKVLRGLVPSRRKAPQAKSWDREHLLFICTHAYKHYRIAYFKSPPDKKTAAPLAAFGWGPDVPARTACEFNLPALVWPDEPSDSEAWVRSWAAAFDVEKVTKKFYEDYAATFSEVEAQIYDASGISDTDNLRLFTQTLFNRLMFLRFIERKGWLQFDGRRNYLAALMRAGPIGKKSVYQSRLRPLFFEGLAVKGKQESAAIGTVPFLNGGLFEENDLDRSAKDVPDSALSPMIGSHGLFYNFNFTVEESTPLDIEVAVDPEMLGKVFERLVTGRRETGSYYTPKPIVSFMCREALKHYLATALPDENAEAIVSLVDDHDASGLMNGDAVLTALRTVKVCDPACGSGAYLLGMLHELLDLRTCLFVSRHVDTSSAYERKLEIIENNLYGVDIDPFAVNIARLRLWLSLAVEYAGDTPPPLPNLDFKIEVGDSLIAPDPQAAFTGQSAFRGDLLRRFRERKAEFMDAHGDEKRRLHCEIDELREELAVWLRSQAPEGAFDWATEFAEVFEPRSPESEAGGFDIIVANPPYISAVVHAASESDSRDLLRSLYPLLRGAFDIYAAFLLRGLSIGHPRGSYSWIVPNKILIADYAKKVLAHLKTNGLYAAIDVSNHDVFENTGVYPIILLGRRPSDTFEEYKVEQLADLRINRLIPRERVREFPCFRDSRVLVASGTTGFQAKAILPYISERQSSNAIPFIVSGCVDRFCHSFESVRYMGQRFQRAFIENHAGLAESKWRFWCDEKIVIAGMTKVIEAVYWREPLALGVGVYAIHDYGGFDPKFLVALLNSRFLSYYLNVKFKDKHLAGGYLAINKSTIEELPLMSAPRSVQDKLAGLVDEVVAAKQNDQAVDSARLEQEIDQLVYKLFSLSDEEIHAVDEFYETIRGRPVNRKQTGGRRKGRRPFA